MQIFDVAPGVWLGVPSSLCVFAETCGRAQALEHNGDLYSCDHIDPVMRVMAGLVMRENLRLIRKMTQVLSAL